MGWTLAFFLPGLWYPLTFLAGPDADEVDVTVCSFDQPTTVAPADHTWVEDQLPWIHLADDLQFIDRREKPMAPNETFARVIDSAALA